MSATVRFVASSRGGTVRDGEGGSDAEKEAYAFEKTFEFEEAVEEVPSVRRGKKKIEVKLKKRNKKTCSAATRTDGNGVETSFEETKREKTNEKSLEEKNERRESRMNASPYDEKWKQIALEGELEEELETLDGDAALNKMFEDLYRNADEDQKRAMMKSFVESNGTVLSTDWGDVGGKTVEPQVPDGMKMKTYET